jgi:hypothetical protein
LSFECLPDGRYVVGPKELVNVEWPRLNNEDGLVPQRVHPGQVTYLDWKKEWEGGQAIRGRISTSTIGGRERVWYQPLYGDLTSTVMLNPAALRPCESDGTYRISPSEARPTAIGIVSGHFSEEAGRSHFIECIQPGTTVTMATQRITLHAAEGLTPVSALNVVYSVDPSGFAMPIRLPTNEVSVIWGGLDDMELALVPEKVSTFAVYEMGKSLRTSKRVADDGAIEITVSRN